MAPVILPPDYKRSDRLLDVTSMCVVAALCLALCSAPAVGAGQESLFFQIPCHSLSPPSGHFRKPVSFSFFTEGDEQFPNIFSWILN